MDVLEQSGQEAQPAAAAQPVQFHTLREHQSVGSRNDVSQTVWETNCSTASPIFLTSVPSIFIGLTGTRESGFVRNTTGALKILQVQRGELFI